MNDMVRRLFHDLLDLSPDERESYFQRQSVPVEARLAVEQLLRLDSSAAQVLMGAVSSVAESLLDGADEALGGLRCGPYRLLRLIGRGGMGSVFLAERADGEVEQRVAIKLLRLGTNDPAFSERFLRERQILATLHHPSLARFLDAGHTASGQPYLAMEYIEGVPIDVYCEKLDLRARLDLFLQVCDAVSYAHRNLIVHRDLKPSNVLVDRDGRPKLLDFGIAKILGVPQGDERTATTQALTPQYASPEQVSGGPITTASDLYSLGVLLYRLLTGRFPYEFSALTPAAVAHAVCEVEPAPPRVSGDLDNILLMALRKEPARRYLSVQHMADDIERSIRDLPVLARPDTFRYRTAKFIRRNRFSVSAAVLALVAIIAGSAIAIYQARVAQQRFQEVRKLAHTFVFDLHDEVAKLEGSTKAREMMVRTGLEYLDNLAKNSGGNLELQKEIASAYLKIGDAEGYPTGPNLGRLNDALESYKKAGDIYARISFSNSAYLPDLAMYYVRYAGLVRFIPDLKRARTIAESAIQTMDRARARDRFSPELENTYISAWCTLGDLDEDLGNEQTFKEFSRCGELARTRVNKTRDLDSLSRLSAADERIGTAAGNQGMFTEALRAFDEDETVLNELLASQPRNPVFRRRLAVLHHYRSAIYYDDRQPNTGDPTRALESAKKYLSLTEDMVQSDPTNLTAKFSRAIATYQVAYCLEEIDAAAAIAMARKSLQMFDEMIASGPSFLNTSRRVRALTRLGEAQLKMGQLADARRTAESALETEEKILKDNTAESSEQIQMVAVFLLNAAIDDASSDFDRAEQMFRAARDEAQMLLTTTHVDSIFYAAHVATATGDFYARHHRISDARSHYQQLADFWQRFPEGNEYVEMQKALAKGLLASLH